MKLFSICMIVAPLFSSPLSRLSFSVWALTWRIRSDASFSFPYGFKHGTILTISEEEYERIRAHQWKED